MAQQHNRLRGKPINIIKSKLLSLSNHSGRPWKATAAKFLLQQQRLQEKVENERFVLSLLLFHARHTDRMAEGLNRRSESGGWGGRSSQKRFNYYYIEATPPLLPSALCPLLGCSSLDAPTDSGELLLPVLFPPILLLPLTHTICNFPRVVERELLLLLLVRKAGKCPCRVTRERRN